MPYRGDSRIAELLMDRGRIAGEQAQRSGQIWGGLAQNLGQIGSSALSSMLQYKQDAPKREMEALQLKSAKMDIAGRKKATEDQSVLGSAMGSRLPPEQVKEQLTQLGRGDLIPIFDKTWSDIETSRLHLKESRDKVAAAEADYFGGMAAGLKKAKFDPMAVEWALNEAETDGHDTRQLRQMLQQNPTALPTLADQLIERSPTQRKLSLEEADRTLRQKQEERAIQTAKDAQADRIADNARQADTLAESARHNQVIEAKQPQEPLVPIMGLDGQSVLVPRTQAVGKRPASNREQGRPVTSGDAGRIADLDTSLNDLDVLERDLGTTGTGSKIGAMLPNAVTDLTGWGAESKQRQAVIDRVKQVIGKALEGGVLRKEDENKYEKILPTIGDEKTVAEAKIKGLREALVKRRQTTIDALSDANYDVTKFQARPPRNTGGEGSFAVTAPNGKTYSFKSQKEMDEFKMATGIK